MKKIFTIILLTITMIVNAQQITEIHYDNTGTDANERIEVTVPAGTTITGWNVVLYNGTGGVTYDTDLVSSGTLTTEGGFDIYVISYASNGIQNGAPDALALVDGGGIVLQFISYEGVLIATNGPANGTSSTDIIASEDGNGTNTGSIQFNTASSTWITNPTQNSFGQLNATLLPVKLTSFTASARNNAVLLNWGVATETGIANYTIERSFNGTTFNTIASVTAQNFSNYSYTDNSSIQGTLYYRLKIVELDGSFSYSIIAKVKLNGKELNINTIYPSPVVDLLTINIDNKNATTAIIDVADFNGKIVLTTKTTLANGLTKYQLNVNALKAGVYMIRVQANNETAIEKFIKQ